MSPRAGFILQDQIVPRLRSAIPTVCHCVGSEDAQELIQDSIALAAKLMHNVEAAGKGSHLTAGVRFTCCVCPIVPGEKEGC